ncbi:MAG: class I SAM-dependent methyltransferase [Prolixibacteraceae bacterium]|nr:class I SAM-dependent methyltransferase [Prolixibacteraceae bacterium]
MGNPFDDKAASWDENPRRIKLVENVWADLEKQLDFTNIRSVLDYGCGTGLLGYKMADRVRHLTFCDVSKPMLEQVERKREQYGYRHVETLWTDFTRDQLPASKFDLIVSMLVLHHVAELEKLLMAFHELLTPKGLFAWIDLGEEDGSFHSHDESIPHKGFSKNGKEALLKRYGMEMVYYTNALKITKEIEGVYREYPLFVMLAKKKSPL